MFTKEEKRALIIRTLKLVHFLIAIIVFCAFWLLFRYGSLTVELNAGFRYNIYVVVIYGVVLLFFNRTFNSYLLGFSRIRSLIFANTLSQFFTICTVYLAVSFAWNHWNNPIVFLLMLVLQALWNVIWSVAANKTFLKVTPCKKTILIYRNPRDKRRFGSIKGKPCESIYHLEEEIKFDGSFDEIRQKLDKYDAVFVAGVNSRCRNGILKYCKEKGKTGLFLPHVGDVIMRESVHIRSFDSPVLSVTRTVVDPEYRIIKRAFDFTASLVGIIVLSPLMLITAIAIKLYDGGPAIYRQVRLTKDEKKFEILKFRSMRVDAEKDGVARLSSGDNDDRITPIGKIVRKCRLDELPQLFNILKGDMSIVGPRPERPEIAEQYYKSIPDFRLRLQVKAGLTGYAQVYGKYNTDPYEKLQFDLLYINSMNVWRDIQLMFATFWILFDKNSTEGVEGVTAINYEEDEDSIRA